MNYKKSKLMNILFWAIIVVATLLYLLEAIKRGPITEG